MTVFILMVLAAWFFVFLAIRTSHVASGRDSIDEAIAIHKERLASLETQHRNGELDPEDYRQFRDETERALLEDTRKQGEAKQYKPMPWSIAIVILVMVGGASFWLYQSWGASDAVEVRRSFIELASAEQPTEAQLKETLTGYKKLLEDHPEDLEGWFRLANMQMELGQYVDAQPSLERVLTLLRTGQRSAEDEATVLAYLGQSLWAQQQNQAALDRFEEALEFNAQHTLALGFAGRLSYELGNYRDSIDYWSRLKRLAGEQADTRVIDEFINRSQAALAEQGIDYEAATGPEVSVQVSLPTAWEGLPDTAALFVYARPPGGRMPLAVKRLPVNAQQNTIVLTDADAMGGMGGLTGQAEVELTARVSFQGTAERSPGDWVAEPVVVDLAENDSPSVSLQVEQP
ncbi:c-type cytochrome biogenesis protein CcmI [Saccharospirillum salsuginis]|uniref:Cytochrome c-type biogenesis protein CycH n=1 Tax=Saccharospirillum salsuginis TaxID=418750 RepID=A0A918NKN5_9GAMM|nr:c-type cytochrome biogenesis protein CcmI [Saccharospirillum salsuginis]GGX75679.1 cytochrome c-type biogenesis protein CycH [Saccharospirillum salsuginis]